MPNLCNKSEYSFDMVYAVRFLTLTTEFKVNYVFVFVIEIYIYIYIYISSYKVINRHDTTLDHTLVENALKQSSFSFYAFNVTTNEFLLINHTESN